ncbi:phage structural protein [Enterococcus faecalis]|uniref:phage structural protein n=1 Tax=Enterococcus faecalis TaxID=1351 RepID=UPI0035D817BF
MQSMTTYDAKEVSTIIDNIVQFGFQDGDMVSFSKDNSYIEVQTDAQGQSSAAKNNDNLGTFTINLSQNSPCNKQLMALANGRKEFAISVTHSTEKAWASKAYIEKTPDGSFGKGVPTRSYTIKALDYKHEYN